MSINDQIVALTNKIDNLQGTLALMSGKLDQLVALTGPFGVAYPDGTVLVQTLQHLKYFIDGSDLIMAPQLIVYRQWEPELCNYFLSALKLGNVFLDVGANFGYYTILAAHAVGASGRVYAIEANPTLCQLLRKNAAINWSIGPIDLLENAAFDRQSILRLYVPKGHAANASLTQTAPNSDVYVVEAKPIDDMVPPGTNVDIMKVDVEGFEIFALRGAERVLKESPQLRIVMEWSQSQIRASGTQPKDIVSFAAELGFVPYQIPAQEPVDENGWEQERLDVSALLEIDYTNILLRRPG